MCINWVPLESSGLHAETIKGKTDEKAETVTERVDKRGERGDSGLSGHICITFEGKNMQNRTRFTQLCGSGLRERDKEETENP